MNNFASRKFVLACMTLISSSWLVYEQVITAGDYKAVVLGVVGVYIAGNVIQKATAKDASGS